MGTRFCATAEAPIHDNVKQAYIDNDEHGSFLIFRSFKNTARVGRSPVSEEVVRRLSQPDAPFSDVQELVAGAAGRELDRKSVGEGKSGSVRVDLGGRRIIKKKTT